jgi:hypothetical protein
MECVTPFRFAHCVPTPALRNEMNTKIIFWKIEGVRLSLFLCKSNFLIGKLKRFSVVQTSSKHTSWADIEPREIRYGVKKMEEPHCIKPLVSMQTSQLCEYTSIYTLTPRTNSNYKAEHTEKVLHLF